MVAKEREQCVGSKITGHQQKDRRGDKGHRLGGDRVVSAALKPAWRNYSALELEATSIVWSLETMAY